MKVLLAHESGDREASIAPDGAGYAVSLGDHERRVEGTFGPAMRVRIDGRPVDALVRREGLEVVVELRGRIYRFRTRDPRAPRLGRRVSAADRARGEVHAPMPGLVVEVLVDEGDAIEAGQPVLVVEAMKMQNALAAPISGRVGAVRVGAGAAVDAGQLLLEIRPEEG